MWVKRRLELVVLLFLLGHLALSWQPVPALWGLDLLSYAPWWYLVIFLLGSLALWPLGSRISGLLPHLPDPWDPGFRGWLVRLMVVGGGLVFFVLWRSQLHLLGDGYLMLRELVMLVDRTGNEPLALWVLAKLYRSSVGLDAGTVYRLYSYVAGVCYVLLAFPVAASLGTAREGRWLVLGVLLTAGYMQVFCGYVENYPPLFPATLLYFWGGLRLLQGRLPLWALSGGLALLMTYHFIAITLAPSLLVAVWLGWRRGHWDGWWRLVGGLALGPVVVLTVLSGVGLDLFAYTTGLRGGHLLPTWAAPDYSQAYGLLSWRHGLDLLAEQLLVAPVVVLVLLGVGGVMRRSWSDERIFFGVAGLLAFLFTALANPEIGAFRDWDVLAFPALPLGLWAACALLERRAWRVGWLVCGAAALHTFVWIGINADTEAGLERFRVLLDEGYLSRHARAYGWETLGAYYRDAGQRERALQAFAHAIAKEPNNIRFREAAAREALALQRPEAAAKALEDALALDDGNPQLWDLLGTAYAADGRYRESVAAHRSAVALQGRDAMFWYNLGNAQLLAGEPAAALKAYREAAVWGGQGSELYYNAGLAHEALGDWRAARGSYEQALQIDSDYAPARLRLTQLRRRLGQTDLK